MKLTKTNLKQLIKEELQNAMALNEYGGHGSVEGEIKITNDLLTKILNVLSQPSQNAAPAEPTVEPTAVPIDYSS